LEGALPSNLSSHVFAGKSIRIGIGGSIMKLEYVAEDIEDAPTNEIALKHLPPSVAVRLWEMDDAVICPHTIGFHVRTRRRKPSGAVWKCCVDATSSL
jgi:hypothetical protein